MADLTTLANTKSWLGITSPNDDALLSRLISASSDYIQTWLNRNIASQTYVQFRNGNDGRRMMFRDYPVTAINYLKIDGQLIPASFGQSSGYVYDSFSIMLIGYSFTRGFQNVELSYTAGYAVTPTEVEQACIELLSLRYKEKDRIGQVSKSIGGEVVSFSQKDMSDSIQTTLANYKKVISL